MSYGDHNYTPVKDCNHTESEVATFKEERILYLRDQGVQTLQMTTRLRGTHNKNCSKLIEYVAPSRENVKADPTLSRSGHALFQGPRDYAHWIK